MQAIYSLTLNNFIATQNEFDSWLEQLRLSIETQGVKSLSQSLTTNLIVWAAWRDTIIVDGAQDYITFTGDPPSMFTENYAVGSYNTVNGRCSAPSKSAYSLSDGIMRVTYEYDKYMANPICATQTPNLFGYSPDMNGNDFLLSLDVSVAMTALAVRYLYHSPTYSLPPPPPPRPHTHIANVK